MESSTDIIANWNVDDIRSNDSIEVQARPILEGEADLVFGDYVKVNHFGSEKEKQYRSLKLTHFSIREGVASVHF